MSVLRAIILLLLFVAWPALSTGPAAPSRPLDLLDVGAPSFTNFSSRDGLPDTVLVAIRTDSEGYVWAASPEGVFRYDGHRWSASPDPAMAQDVDSLWLDSHGTLWAALRSRGLASYDGSRWHVENLKTGLPSQQVRRFAESVDADGHATLWAVTWDHGLMVRRKGRWQADPDNASLPSGTVLAMVQTKHIGGHRRLWVGMGSQGLWYRDEGTRGWQQWHAEGIDSSQVEYLLATMRHGHEELWISVFSNGLYRLTDGGLRHWSKESGELPTNEIYDLAATPLPGNDSSIWVSSRSGLLRIHDDRVQVFDRRHGLSSNAIRGLNAWRSPSGADVIWLATEAGVSRTVIGTNAWSTASLMGAGSIGVFGVLVEPDDSGGERLWVGASDDGLGLYQHGRWRYYTAAAGDLPAASVSMVAVTTGQTGKRTHWIGLRGGDLLQVDLRNDGGLTFDTKKTPWPKTSGQAVLDTLVRHVDGQDEQWVATRQTGVYRWRDGRWTAFRPNLAHGQWAVVKLQQQVDASGRSWLWASTNQGLARFDGKRWKLFGQRDGLTDPNLIGLSLIKDARGHPILWAGTSSAGITRADVSDPEQPQVLPNTLPPAPDAGTYDALRDASGHIYICTNNGVQLLTPDTTGYRSKVFSRRDGMVNDECNTNARFIDSHDRYWTGTLGGLTVYDPHREVGDKLPKPLRITGVTVGAKAVKIDAVLASGLQVGTGKKSVEVQFALLSWYRETESRFRTQLVGFDDSPGSWTAQASRTFNALPPGSYRLHVEARDHAGNVSTPIDLPITVEVPWWQRWWAQVAAVIALLLLAHAAIQWRTRRLQAQRQALERNVTARTIELDEANARLVQLSYHDALTAVANRRRLLEQLQQLDGTTDAQSPAADHALIFVDVDHFKACNDRFGHPAGDEVLRAIAATMLRCAPDDALVARYGGEEFACLMPGADTAQAAVVAERMRVAVAACQVPVPDDTATMKVTISAGIASSASHDIYYTHHHLLRDADLALYQAKTDGRNCVRTWPGTNSSATKSNES